MDSETEERLVQLLLPWSSSSSPSHPSSPVLLVDDDENDPIQLVNRLSSVSVSVSSSSSRNLPRDTKTVSPLISSSRFHFDDDTDESISTTNNNSIVIMSQQAWEMTGHWISIIQNEVNELENDGMLGSAIIRTCQELADTIAHITTDLRHKQQRQYQQDDDDDDDSNNNNSNSNENQLPVFEHNVNSLLLHIEQTMNNSMDDDPKNRSAVYDDTTFDIPSTVDEYNDNIRNDNNQGIAIIDPLPSVIDLLQDMEQALRSIEMDDANDLAEAAITVGHLLVAALQQLHSQFRIVPSSTTTDPKRGIPILKESPNITRLSDEDNNDDDDDDDITNINDNWSNVQKSTESTVEVVTPPPPVLYEPTYTPKRVRCIWPSLQPVAENIVQYTQQEIIQKQPIYITAPIILTTWPIIVTSSLVIGGIVITDQIVQHIYYNIQDHPLVVTSEMTMASLLQTMKLGYLTSKVVAKPTIRVVQKQIQRHTPQIQSSLLYHIHHPIEAIHTTIHNLDRGRQHIWSCIGPTISEWIPPFQRPMTTIQEDNIDFSVSDDCCVIPLDLDDATIMLQRMSL